MPCSCGEPIYRGRFCRDCRNAQRRIHEGGGFPLTVDAEPVADMIEDMLIDADCSMLELSRRVGVNEATIRKIVSRQRRRVKVQPTLDRLCNYGDKLLYDFFDPR